MINEWQCLTPEQVEKYTVGNNIQKMSEFLPKQWPLKKRENIANETSTDVANTLEATEQIQYSDFGNPDEDEKKKIDSWSEEYREKVKGKIEFGAEHNGCEVTILTIPNGKKLIFDKTPILDSDTKGRSWDEAMDFAKENNRETPSNDDFKVLSDGFHGNENELKGILKLTHDYYWSNTANAHNVYNARYGTLICGYLYTDYNSDTSKYTLCIHESE